MQKKATWGNETDGLRRHQRMLYNHGNKDWEWHTFSLYFNTFCSCPYCTLFHAVCTQSGHTTSWRQCTLNPFAPIMSAALACNFGVQRKGTYTRGHCHLSLQYLSLIVVAAVGQAGTFGVLRFTYFVLSQSSSGILVFWNTALVYGHSELSHIQPFLCGDGRKM